MKKLILISLLTFLISLPIYSKVLDNMDQKDGWATGTEEGTEMTLNLVKGKSKKAIEIDYDLKEKNWVQIIKDINTSIEGMQVIKFDLKGSGAANNIEFKFEDADGSVYGMRFEKATAKKSWETVIVPISALEYFWGGDKNLDTKNIAKIFFAISKADGGKGKLLIDNIELSSDIPKGAKNVAAGFVKIKKKAIDKMDSTDGWENSIENQAKLETSTVSAKNGKGIKMDYDFVDGNWLQIQKQVKVNIEGNKKICFYLKGSGSVNTFQFKLEDEDGSVYGKNFDNLLPVKTWQKIEIPISELQYFWGGDKTLNLQKIKLAFFCITKVDGGKGTLIVDDFQAK